MMTAQDLAELELGIHEQIVVCHVPLIVANLLWAATPIVYLSRESLAHIWERHPDMTRERVLLLPKAIVCGLIVERTDRPRHLSVCYEENGQR
jgi:hypothetical protein